MPSFYPEVRNGSYANILYSLCIAIDAYYTSRILNNDNTRVIYCSTDYALIKRSGQNQWSNANLPFVNYKMDEKTIGGPRNWTNFVALSQGIYIPELQQKFKIVPINIGFDSTFWAGRDDDYQYALDQLLYDASKETILEYYLDYNGTEVKNIGILDFNLSTAIQFTENDWLEKNQIWSFSINPSVQTFLPVSNRSGFCIPKRILIDFAVKKDLIPASDGDVIEYQEAFDLVVDHINKTITLV